MLTKKEMLLDAPACQPPKPDSLALQFLQFPLAVASREEPSEAARHSRVLYLDFDGVLHPNDVFLENGAPVLRPDPACGIQDWVQLFSFAKILETELEPYPEIQIVLSTTWAARIGVAYATNALPEGLRHRVIGATCAGRHALEEWLLAPSRCAQIARHAATHEMEWIAIDDDTEGWPNDQRHRLVGIENPTMVLFDEAVQQRLREVLR